MNKQVLGRCRFGQPASPSDTNNRSQIGIEGLVLIVKDRVMGRLPR